MLQPRHKAFLEELPKNGNKVKPSAIKAGYSPIYAHANGRKILKTAIKAQAQEIIDVIDKKDTKSAMLMYEQIGLNKENLYENLIYLLNQEKDLATRLKVLSPLIAELGIQLNDKDEPKTIVPILNIGVRAVDNGSIEPHNPNDPLNSNDVQ